MRIAFCQPQVPFERGGAEEPFWMLVAELGAEGRAYSRRELGDAARAAQEVGIDPYGPEPGKVGRSAREVALDS
jgi:hypothetical protein